jgi:hypothetical protein
MQKKQKKRRTKNAILVNVNVLLLKENACFVASCPALEVSSYGEAQEDAKSAFDKAPDIFTEETQSNGSFEKALLKQGWSLRQVPQPSFTPPKNKLGGLAKLTNKKTSKFKAEMALPF